VKGRPTAAQLAALAGGVRLADGVSAPARVRPLTLREHKAWIEISVTEGKNREVRRMCEAVGLPVEKLIRVALGPLRLGKLPPGAWRTLDAEEVAALHAELRQRPSTAARTRVAPTENRRARNLGSGDRRARKRSVRSERR
jgi:23S rRNA pseudouridine2605 synthase